MKNTIIVGGVLAILLASALISVIYYQSANKPSLKETVIRAVFHCDNKKTISAEFVDDKVKLQLSDLRKMELNRAISASGARYANSDETFVFWNKGDTAFVEENGQTTYADCLEAGQK